MMYVKNLVARTLILHTKFVFYFFVHKNDLCKFIKKTLHVSYDMGHIKGSLQ
jgi:hypothetical protein